MDTLEDAMLKAAGQLPHLVLAQLLDEKLKVQGVKLSKRRIKELAEHILSGHAERLTFDDKRKKVRTIRIDLTDDDLDRFTRRIDVFVRNDLPRVTESLLESTSADVFQVLKARWPRESRVTGRYIDAFRKRLAQRWGQGLEELKMLVAISREFGSTITSELSRVDDFHAPQTLYVLSRLHARACQIAEEVICLLSNGFADGAMARWRTLHGIAAVSLLISEHGEELAERYIAHEIVETRRAALQYERFQARLGQEPLTHGELRKIEQVYKNTIARFGEEFGNPRGWASKHLKKANPTIANINEAARLDHLSPYYRLASHNVHADPKGTFFKLGIIGESELLLAGPSNAGLADPGFGTVRSLNQVSCCLLCLSSTFDNVVAVKIMTKLGDEIFEALSNAEEKLIHDDRKFTQHLLSLVKGVRKRGTSAVRRAKKKRHN
jgi:Family of unknown function (DUF5677)